MALWLLLAVGSVAVAHEETAASDPPAGSSVRTMPTQITITFTGEIDPQGSSATVSDSSGADIAGAVGTVDLNNPDRNTIVIPVPSNLADGTYTVHWTNVSGADGHQETGEFSFTVDPNAPESTPVATTISATTATSATPTPGADADSGSNRRGALFVVASSVFVVIFVTVMTTWSIKRR